MKKWLKSKWLMITLFLILLVGTTVLLVVGIATHTEPGFVDRENAWGSVPLTVSCAGYVAPDDDACDAAVNVVDTINIRLGFTMLELSYGEAAAESDIHITMRAPVEVAEAPGASSASSTTAHGSTGTESAEGPGPSSAGSAGPCSEPGECFELTGTGTTYERCEMQTMNVSGGASDLEWLVVYHGLGHCMGLAHDDYDQSIMRPTQAATLDRQLPPWISDWDRELLRGKYMEE
jgi:hypothetical protein